jgi:hypothetical protein
MTITNEHIFHELLALRGELRRVGAGNVAVMTDINAKASAINDKFAAIEAGRADIKAAIDSAVAMLTATMDTQNQQQLDGVMAILVAIDGKADALAAADAALKAEVTQAIAAASPLAPQ